MGQQGEVFLLDMGEPIRTPAPEALRSGVADLAADLIELSGLKVGEDVQIVYTGLRPGEKMFEELFIPGEQYGRTRHEKIFVVHNGAARPAERGGAGPASGELDAGIEQLLAAARQGQEGQVRARLQALVPGYRPAPPP